MLSTRDVAEQLQHISALTALKEFSFCGSDRGSAEYDPTDLMHKLSGIGHLLQLTSLDLSAHLHFSTSSTSTWVCLTSLESLSLWGTEVQPQALAALTQLRALSLMSGDTLDAPYQQLIGAVSQRTLLTQLTMDFGSLRFQANLPAAAAFTALTTSTNLC